MATVKKEKKQTAKQKPKRMRVRRGKAGQNLPVQLSRTMTGAQVRNDPRNSALSNPDYALKNQANQIVETVTISGASILGYAMGYVSMALQKGFAGTSEVVDPYNVTVYLRDLILGFMAGTVPMVSSLPLWLLCLVRALAPKSVRFQQGLVSYRWNIIPTPAPTPVIPIGPAAYGYSWCVGLAEDVQFVDLFPVALTNLTYVPSEGALAWTSLAQQMMDDKNPWTKMVTLDHKTPYDSDVSAFAVTAIPEGGGFGSGGWAFNAQLEVPLFNKLLSTLVAPQINAAVSPLRYPNFSSMNCGDPIFTGALAGTAFQPMTWGLQTTPRLHFVDFNEFADVLATWVSMVQTQFQADPQTGTNNTVTSGSTIAGTICPLTLQEMTLILRNTMMEAFKETQPAVQGLFPCFPDSANDPQPVVFTAGANTCFLDNNGMKLPQGIVENIRALVARAVPRGKNGFMSFIPALGIIQGDVLSTSDYQFVSYSGEISENLNSFASDSGVSIQKISKGVSTMVPEVATVISLVDGSYSSGSGSGFVFINCPDRLKQLTEIWNDWVSQFAPFSDPLCTLATELGINILASVCTTRQVTQISPQTRVKQATIVDSRIVKHKYLQSLIYSARQSVAVTSQSKILAAPYELILSTWILPVNYITLGEGVSNQTSYQRWQAIMGEPYAAVSSTGNDGILLSTNHANYAAKMVHGRNAQPSDWQQFFDSESEKGRGGILSGLVASLAGDIFGPEVGAVASGIASVIPF